MSIILIKNLSKSYPVYQKKEGLVNSLKDFFKREYYQKEAVKNFNLEIEQGEIVGFLGENGAGKTTTLKMLSGVLHPTSGQIRVLDFVPHERKKEFLRNIAFVMGNRQQLIWDLPAMESFRYQKEIFEIPTVQYKKTLDMLVELMGVESLLNIQIRKLSLGERMKMELINSLLYSPKIIFLDEPTIGLDLITQKRIRKFLVNYNKESQATIILTSHYMEDIESTCKRVVMIRDGEKVHDSSMKDLIENHLSDQVVNLTFNSLPDMNRVAMYGNIIDQQGLVVQLVIPKKGGKNLIAKIIQDFDDLLDISFSSIPFKMLIEDLMTNK